MNNLLRALVVSAAVLVVAACAPASGANRTPAADPVTVELVNQNRRDVRVYVLRGGTSVRRGTVLSGGTATFTYRGMAAGQSETLQVGADVIGGDTRYTSAGVRVAPGERVALRVEDLIQSSSIAVRRP